MLPQLSRVYGLQHPRWDAAVDAACPCDHSGWDGKRRISYQQQKDLFYNYYAQPGPYYNTPRQMYVSPLPVPANVGHTYTTYQPFMPHEYTYRTSDRTTPTTAVGLDTDQRPLRHVLATAAKAFCYDWHFPMSNNITAVHNDFYHPGQRW